MILLYTIKGIKNFTHLLADRYQVFDNRIEWQNQGRIHRVNGPAKRKQYFQQGKLHSLDSCSIINGESQWYVNGQFHKVNQPAVACHINTNIGYFYLYGKAYGSGYQGEGIMHHRHNALHHDSECAAINKLGDKYWYFNNRLHREDGPAIITKDGDKYWYINGKRHRVDGPTVITSNGDQEWYINDKLHREDGPAVIRADGDQEWWIKGKLHRKDGPAVIKKDGTQKWYFNGLLHRIINGSDCHSQTVYECKITKN